MGKTIANRAPSLLLIIIDRKLKYFGEKLVEINTHEARANQFNHFDSKKVQRDMYSTFLIMNVNSDLKSFNIEKCNERFYNFYRLHNLEVERLIGNKNLSSIAI